MQYCFQYITFSKVQRYLDLLIVLQMGLFGVKLQLNRKYDLKQGYYCQFNYTCSMCDA